MSSRRFSPSPHRSQTFRSRSRDRSRGSRDSSRSAGGSTRDHDFAVNFYSPDNGHWATYTRQRTQGEGIIQHVRSDPNVDDDKFYYDERSHPEYSRSLYGRSVISRMSAGEADRAQASIRSYASDDNHIPRLSRRENCQTFVVGSLDRLEQDRLLRPGNSRYFSQFYGRGGQYIGRQLQRDGRHFEERPRATSPRAPDARFNDPRPRPDTGRLDMRRYSRLG